MQSMTTSLPACDVSSGQQWHSAITDNNWYVRTSPIIVLETITLQVVERAPRKPWSSFWMATRLMRKRRQTFRIHHNLLNSRLLVMYLRPRNVSDLAKLELTRKLLELHEHCHREWILGRAETVMTFNRFHWHQTLLIRHEQVRTILINFF